MRAERSLAGLPVRVAATYLVLGIAAFALYSFMWSSAPALDGDSSQYMEVARDLTDFRLDALHYRSPGYPALIALTGSADVPRRELFHVSLLLHFASVWLLALILRAAGVGERSLIFFGGLLTLPPYVEPAGYVMTENLAQFFLVAGLCGLVMWFARRQVPWLIVGSVAIGLAGLTRPIYQLLGIALAIGLVLFRSRRSAAVALVAASVLLLGGLAISNSSKFGYFGVVPSLGFHLSTKTMPWVERLPGEYSAAKEVLIRERDAELTKPGGRHNGTQTIWNAREELGRVTGLDLAGLSSYLVRMNLTIIRAAPIEYLEEVARAVPSYWFPAAGPLATMRSSLLRWTWGLMHVAVVGTFLLQLIVLIGVGVFEFSRRRGFADVIPVSPVQKAAYLFGLAIVGYTMVLTCVLDIGEPRQRRPTDVIVVLLCFLGAHVWAQARKPTVGGTE